MKTFMAYIEYDPATKVYIGIIPNVPGARTQAESLDELKKNLKEVLELCLEEAKANGDSTEYPQFAGLQQIEIAEGVMEMPNDFMQQIKLEAFRQHWEQIRHDEKQRLSFTSFYAVLVAGVLAFISQTKVIDHTILYLVLCVVSLFGLWLSLRLMKAMEGHKERAKAFASELSGKSTNLDTYVPFWSASKKWIKLFSLRVLFPFFFSLGFILFLLLALKVFSLG